MGGGQIIFAQEIIFRKIVFRHKPLQTNFVCKGVGGYMRRTTSSRIDLGDIIGF